MATATKRIVVQVTPQQKATIVGAARELGLNISDFMRRAAENFRGETEDRDLEALLRQVEESTQRANAALDHALASVASSEQRLAELESRKASKPRAARRKS
ncbi:plasmid mobilization protein [Candidatus Methylocalor cossyra]|uniref:Ribbon-helix-helix protein CopG domain-containing protein n=1 Tax=Candidatus Methylocalor cossyra TaxID=3108543 RepID=A0ABM9NLS1_9GAMM